MSHTLPRLHSISPVVKYHTTAGSEPIEMLCNDFKHYICKYASPSAHSLFREYIAYQFALLWQLPVPAVAVVDIAPAHVSHTNNRLTHYHLRMPCIGSQRLESAKEIDHTFTAHKNLSHFKNIQKNDLLMIAIFDLWLANEDRTENNPNILLHAPPKGLWRIVPIDHERIFNSGGETALRPLADLTYEDSILASSVFSALFAGAAQSREAIQSFKDIVYLCAADCQQVLPQILAATPAEWQIDLPQFERWAHQNLFSDAWLAKVEDNFLYYCQQSL